MQRKLFEPEHEDFRQSVRDFLDRHVRPRYEDFIAAKAFPRDLWIEAGKQGFLGITVSEEYGGGGSDDYLFDVVLSEELAAVSMALVSCVGIHTSVNAPYLIELTSDEQKRRWLPKYCSGEMVTAIAMTEPGGGSDLAALKTTAVREGDHFVVNGSKTFITNGFIADLVIVAARTAPEKGPKGISLLAVERGMPGFSRGRKLDKVGQEESDTAEMFFEDVRVPVTNLIGQLDRGFVHMMEQLPAERISSAIGNIAHVAAVLDETLAYVKQRQAFGRPIGSFQHNKFLLAELYTQVEVAQAYVDRCIEAFLEGRLNAIDAAKAKWWTAQVQNDVLDHCVQLHGGYGFMNEYRVARAWRDARVTKIWAGSNEIMKELIGRDLGL